MITNDYTNEMIVSDDMVISQRGFHKIYVKQSKIKHVLFALFVVALLIFAGLYLNTLV